MSFFPEGLAAFKGVQASNGAIQTRPFLEMCSKVLPIVDKLGSGFILVQRDIGGNIDRLKSKVATNPSRFDTDIFNLVKAEVEAGTHNDSSSCTKGLLWLSRAMTFVVTLLGRLEADPEVTLRQAAQQTYAVTLQRYHGWLVSGTFSMALNIVPGRTTFFQSLGMGEEPSGEEKEQMKEYCSRFENLLKDITAWLDKEGLNDPAEV